MFYNLVLADCFEIQQDCDG